VSNADMNLYLYAALIYMFCYCFCWEWRVNYRIRGYFYIFCRWHQNLRKRRTDLYLRMSWTDGTCGAAISSPLLCYKLSSKMMIFVMSTRQHVWCGAAICEIKCCYFDHCVMLPFSIYFFFAIIYILNLPFISFGL
jgi:hypothetical protein